MQELLLILVIAVVVSLAAASLWRWAFATATVYEYERGLRYDNGRLTGVLGPGRYRHLRPRTRIDTLDVRPALVVVPGQEVITADGVSIRVSLVAEYGFADIVVAHVQQGDYVQKLYAQLQLALRHAVAQTDIDALLEQRADVGPKLLELVRDDAVTLGLTLLSVDVKDFMFPGELRKTFAAVVAARKEGLAALERARGETAALRNLANAARMMEGNPALMHLRLLQELGRAGGNTVVLGMPGGSTPLPIRDASTPRDVEAPTELPPSDE